MLGLAFNWGALSWAAVKGSLALPAILLYMGSILLDHPSRTIYAHQDTKDDLMLGLKSTRPLVWRGYAVLGRQLLCGRAAAGDRRRLLAGTHLMFFFGVALVGLQMAWQVSTLDISDAKNCPAPFPRQSRWWRRDLSSPW